MAFPRFPVGVRVGAFLSVFVLVFAACGGGGGGDDEAPIPSGQTPVPDNDAPRIIAVEPAPGSVDQEPTVRIALTFATQISPISIVADRLSVLTGDGAVPGQVTLENGDRTLVFSPLQGVPLSAEPRVLLRAGLLDADGNLRSEDFEYSFRTRNTVPLPPSPLETDPESMSLRGFELADDGSGFALMLRREQSGVESVVLQRYADGVPTGIPDVIFSTQDSIAFSELPLAVASGSQGAVAWQVHSTGDPDAGVAFFDPATFQWEVHAVEENSQRAARPPLVGVSNTGRGLAMWLEEPLLGEAEILRSARRFPSTSNIVIDNHGTVFPARDLTMSMNEAGHGVISWVEQPSTTVEHVKVSGIFGGQPLLPVDVETRTVGVESNIAVSVSAEGRGTVAWSETDASSGVVRVLAVVGNALTSTWTQPRILHQVTTVDEIQVTGGEGTAAVFWSANVAGVQRLYGSRYRINSGVFEGPETLSGLFTDVTLTGHDSNARGDLLVSFLAGTFHLRAVCWPADDDPTDPAIVAGDVPQQAARVALEPSGAGLIAYARAINPNDQQVGNLPALRRIGEDGTLEPEVDLGPQSVGVFVNRLFVDVDAQGRGFVAVNLFDVVNTTLEVSGISLQ